MQSILRRLFHSLTLILRCKLYLETYLNQKNVKLNYWITRHGDIGLHNSDTSFICFCTHSTRNHELEYWFVNFVFYILWPMIIATLVQTLMSIVFIINLYDILYGLCKVNKWIGWGFHFCMLLQIVELINVSAKKMLRGGNVIVVREDSSVFSQTI